LPVIFNNKFKKTTTTTKEAIKKRIEQIKTYHLCINYLFIAFFLQISGSFICPSFTSLSLSSTHLPFSFAIITTIKKEGRESI